jgi:Protein of unknown function (DUF2878)
LSSAVSKSLAPRFINAIGFQAAWWACVAGVGRGFEIPALLFCVALGIAHLLQADAPYQEAKLALAAFILGVAVDSWLQVFSVINFYGWAFWKLSPFWLWALWVLFAMTLNSSLAFLKQRPLWLSAALGGLLGPITYLAGTKLGAASFDNSVAHVCFLALVWMVSMPTLVLIAQWTSPTARSDT